MEKFTKLGLSRDITEVLLKHGFKEPTEIQEEAIPIALAGKDIIGGSATGSGKTLVFASAIIENLKPNREIQALILTPTRELAEQVATAIRNFGKNKKLNVLAVYGGVKIEPQMRKLSTADVLVGTPGRILDHIKRRTLRLDKIKILVLDEVDRMFDMGFSRDVEKIIRECPKKRQTMMFSATISQDIDYLAKKYSNNPVEISVEPYVDPSKLKQVYYDVPDNKKFSLLVSLLKQEGSHFVLVFCSTRRNVDFVADNLIRAGVKAKAIHGGLHQKKRLRVLDEFKKKGRGVLVCTDVAARGLDIVGVSHVYNYDVPADAKDYIHRIGRTARAGKEGKAITILASRDYEKFGTIMQSEEINIPSKELPELEIVRIKIDFGDSRNRFNRGSRRKSFGRIPRRDQTGGSRRPNRSYGPNRDRPRRTGGYGPRGNRGYSSGRSGPRRYGRSSGPSYIRGKNSSRDRPRSSNRSPNSKRPSSGGYVNKNSPRRDKSNKRSSNFRFYF